MAESKEPERLVPNLGAVRCPVLLVVGTAPHEGGIPERQLEALQHGLVAFVVDSVPGAGLHVYEERPDAIVQAVRQLRTGTSSP
jgi:pimeloyl-ACP methyl ester carboxylesterase